MDSRVQVLMRVMKWRASTDDAGGRKVGGVTKCTSVGERNGYQFKHGRDRKGQECGSQSGGFPTWVVEE